MLLFMSDLTVVFFLKNKKISLWLCGLCEEFLFQHGLAYLIFASARVADYFQRVRVVGDYVL